eukprot:m.5400 g.5400  ORF g.5400 m.5400 type:complete len:51 (+) comp4965_c0_seq1:85-237(+)
MKGVVCQTAETSTAVCTTVIYTLSQIFQHMHVNNIDLRSGLCLNQHELSG